jgi:hypothetical protein
MMLAISQHSGHRLAEVGFVLGLIGGAALAVSAVVPSTNQIGKLVSGVALALGSLLLIIAAHSGRFG